MAKRFNQPQEHMVKIPFKEGETEIVLTTLEKMKGLVFFLHSSEDDPHGLRDESLAEDLWERGMGTVSVVLYDKLPSTPLVAPNLELLVERISKTTDWILSKNEVKNLPIGFYAGGIGAAAALMAEVQHPDVAKTLVLQNGTFSLVSNILERVKIPVLLLVGSLDQERVEEGRQAFSLLQCKKEMHIIEGGNRLFQEGDAWDNAVEMASDWFSNHLGEAYSLLQRERSQQRRNQNLKDPQDFQEQGPRFC